MFVTLALVTLAFAAGVAVAWLLWCAGMWCCSGVQACGVAAVLQVGLGHRKSCSGVAASCGKLQQVAAT